MPKNSFFDELKNRNVFKVGSIYVVTAWLIIQVVATTFPIFEFPTWSQRLIVILIIIGFPVALILAWTQEIKRTFSEDRVKKSRWAVFISILGIGAMAFTVWWFGRTSNEEKKLLSTEIREEKVAVNVFENFTQDETLDAFGFLGSEWISSGLRELDIPTVSAEMVRQHKDKLGILPGNSKEGPSFAEITGAKYVITGSYYSQGDSLVLNTRLSSTETGEEVRTFPPIFGSKSQKEVMIEEARQLLLGYWILRRDQKLPNINPPKYAAYQVFLKCRPSQADCYQRALDIDPDFLLARILKMGSLTINSKDSVYHADKAFVEERLDECTEFEKNWFRMVVFAWEANYKGALEAHEALYKLDSNDYHTMHQTAYVALNGNNMPHRAIEIFDRLFVNIELYKDQVLPWSFRHYTDALNRIGAHKEVSDFYTSLPEILKQRADRQIIENVIRALIHQNRIAEALDIIETGRQSQRELCKGCLRL